VLAIPGHDVQAVAAGGGGEKAVAGGNDFARNRRQDAGATRKDANREIHPAIYAGRRIGASRKPAWPYGQAYKTKHIAAYWSESSIAFGGQWNLQYVSSREGRFRVVQASGGTLALSCIL